MANITVRYKDPGTDANTNLVIAPENVFGNDVGVLVNIAGTFYFVPWTRIIHLTGALQDLVKIVR